MPARRPAAVTMAEVAARAGVSRALVSIVFRDVPGASPETRERVRQAAAELGYRPDSRAQSLGRSRSRTIGVVFDITQEFHAEMVQQLYDLVDGSDYELSLGAATGSRPETRAAQSLLDFRCEALVLVGSRLPRRDLEDLAQQLPTVLIARALPPVVADVVRTNDVTCGRLAVAHLAELGHRDIVHADGGRSPGAAERRRGYHAEMSDRGLAELASTIPGGVTTADGESAAALLMKSQLPTAVTAFNDHCAAGLMASVRMAGRRIPDELSLTGVDDSQLARLSMINLTTIAQDSAALARAALLRVEARLEHDDAPAEVVIEPRLVVRGSTAAPSPAPTPIRLRPHAGNNP